MQALSGTACVSQAFSTVSLLRPSSKSIRRNCYVCPAAWRQQRQYSVHRRRLQAFANGGNLGEWGARDPFPAEVESSFGTKVLGNADTEHQILVPNVSNIVGLATRTCQPIPEGTKPLTEEEARTYLRRLIGWRLVETDTGLRLRCDLKVKNFESGLELFRRVAQVAEQEGHHPDLHLERWNQASIELYTHSIGGLHENDFIVAAKVDSLNTSDLLPKRTRTWF